MEWWNELLTGMPTEYDEVINPYTSKSGKAQRKIADHLWMLMDEAIFQDAIDRGIRSIRGNPYEFIEDDD